MRSRTIFLILFSILELLLVNCNSIKSSGNNPSIVISCLTNGNTKFWDGLNDYGFIICEEDSKILEYAYDNIGRRIKASYGDDIVEFDLKWKLNYDTLSFILSPSRKFQEDIIYSLSKDSLVLMSTPIKNSHKRYFVKAKDQKTMPIEGNILSPDTLNWPIRLKMK